MGVTPNGEINIEDIALKIKENTALVSILYVNNEIGTISDVEAVSALCRNNNIAFHSDLTQALGKMQIDIKKWVSIMHLVLRIRYMVLKE